MSVKGKRQLFPYVSVEVQQTLKTYCAAKGVTDSAVVESALREYFADARDSALVMRRLDRNDRTTERARQELALLSELVSSWIRVWYAHTPPLPVAEKKAAGRAGSRRHEELLDHVSNRIKAGNSLATEVLAAVAAVAESRELAAAAAKGTGTEP